MVCQDTAYEVMEMCVRVLGWVHQQREWTVGQLNKRSMAPPRWFQHVMRMNVDDFWKRVMREALLQK